MIFMKRKILLFPLLFLAASFASFECAKAAVMEDVSFRVEDGITRLVLVLSGELPQEIITDHNRALVSFKELNLSSSTVEKLRDFRLPSGIKDFQVRKGQPGSLEIDFSVKPEYVERLVLPAVPPSAGKYRLILDILFSAKIEKTDQEGKKEAPEVSMPFIEEKMEEPSPPPRGFVETAPPIGQRSGIVPFVEAFYEEAKRAFEQKHYKRAFVLFDRYLQKNGEIHRVDALYGKAFSFYEMNRDREADVGFDMIQLFGEAISADSTHEKALEAQCLTARTYFILGVTKRASDMFEELKKKATTNRDKLCALKGLGMVKIKNGEYIEAVSILNDALELEAPVDEEAELHFLLGEALSGAGAYLEALKNFGSLLELKPDFYLEEPDVVKLIGEAFFALRDYQSARDFLIWYLNLDDQARENSMVWAEIAESMLQSGKMELAERLQNKIIVEMPDTEGAYITLLRKAQYLEQKGTGGRFQAETIYQDLSQKNLPIPLKEIAFFRWADLKRREGKIEESLDIVNRFLSTVPPSVPVDDFLVLKSKLLNEAVIENFRQKLYSKVTSLYETADENVEWSIDALEAIASSYEKLEMYPQALVLYEKLVDSGKKSESLYLSIARIAYLLGDAKKAEKYAQMLKEAENLKEKLTMLARIYMERRDYNAALAQFESLTRLGTLSPELTLLYLQCAGALKRCDLVSRLADEIAFGKEDITDSMKYSALSQKLECYRNAGKVDEAIKVAGEMIKLASDEPVRCQTLYLLASLQRRNGDMKETELTLQELSKCKDPLWKKVAEQELAFMKLTGNQSR
ncbi:tetratricopeptide repeat protein [Thermodesulforhabdus norvegica]|uniref:Flp pilus assembly protein TadD, contains TPR repeats n=1 Tax=Thermodesulforhabdus norvegica TaxID=39841 RepID=A0A1I4R6T2_9BACT|nr:tetratricopeptide repeat protein [Thermodesulforhabdus norvegica]SFM47875.1 Flp pilus assembly protein TadD, contains TPR repeats [Thermodesulforhabdus norvegica]